MTQSSAVQTTRITLWVSGEGHDGKPAIQTASRAVGQPAEGPPKEGEEALTRLVVLEVESLVGVLACLHGLLNLDRGHLLGALDLLRRLLGLAEVLKTAAARDAPWLTLSRFQRFLTRAELAPRLLKTYLIFSYSLSSFSRSASVRGALSTFCALKAAWRGTAPLAAA